MFATAGSSSSSTDYVKLFETSTANFSDAPKASTPNGDPFCWCGFNGTLVSYEETFYYIANDAFRYKPGSSQWETIAGYTTTPGARVGEAATAALKERIYRVGGRELSNDIVGRTQYYAIGTGPDVFVATGLADHPVEISNACAGAYEDKLYVLSYLNSGTARMAEYTTSDDIWVILPEDDNAPGSCWGRNFPLWRKFLLHSWNGFRRFNVDTRLWEPDPIPVPDPTATLWTPAVTSDGVLYAIGYQLSEDETEKTVVVYQWVLD